MVKIIEAKAILSASDQTAGAFKGVIDKLNAITNAQRVFASSGAKELGLYTKHVDAMNKQLGAIDGFRAQHAALIAARQQYRGAQSDVERLGRSMRENAAPTREMTREYERSQKAVKQAAAAYQEKVVAIKAAKAEMASYGVTTANISKAQARAQAVANAPRPAGPSGVTTPAPLPGRVHGPVAGPESGGNTLAMVPKGMIGPAVVGYAGLKLHGAIVDKHHDYQQAYLYQQAVLGLNADQQAPLLSQATKIGQDTKFTNADIVKAQTDIGAKLPKNLQNPATIAAITEHTKNYALAMKVSMEEASTAMVGWMKARGYDLSDPAAAEKSARRTANQMVEFAKTTGAKHHDLAGDTRFGAATGKAGGFSEEFSMALSAQLMRLGFEGAASGTFVRAAAMKLSAPTQKGLAAISAAGLNFDDYVKPGTDPSVGGFGKMIQQRFGRGLTPDQTSKLREVFDNENAMGDRGSFVEAVSNILNSTFARKNKDGKVNAQDAERIAKTANEFHTLSAEGVNTEKLMSDLVRRGMTPAIAKYLFGTDRGGQALGINSDQLGKDVQNYKNVPNNRAETVANTMQQGAQGEYTKMAGSVETFVTALGEATDGARSFAYKGIGGLFDAMTWMISGKGTKLPGANSNPDGSQYFSPNPLNDPAIMEQARRATDLRRRDPEAARGHAFSKLPEPSMDFSKITAVVDKPVDVTGKVESELKGQADINVRIKVEGNGTVTGQGVSASGHVRASVGTTTAGEYGSP